ncbi:MAG: bis(5'-nucleosyl)-tetraphosphatase (symmetrical) YqeK [Candidatus Eremiobacteraeota bacterium]|nr:bis(5'-nucleosyl)-tetraphosphatase (symmetrical) YqeK [Candidatus Eremiobacteraeota bacterium]
MARTAENLALKYGASTLKARLAGLLHDIARVWAPDELMRYAATRGLPVSQLERAAPVLLHARVAADIVKSDFGLQDAELLQAIERHTLAVTDMSDLDKIVYIADSLEPSRRFEGRGALVAAVGRSLDEGMLACLKSSLQYSVLRGLPLAHATVDAYNELLSRRG